MVVVEGMDEMGSRIGYVFVLAGGIFGLLVGLGFFVWIVLDLKAVNFFEGDPVDRSWFLARIIIGLYISVLNSWIISVAKWMRQSRKVKKAAIISLIFGTLSLNLLVILGSIFGLGSLRRRVVKKEGGKKKEKKKKRGKEKRSKEKNKVAPRVKLGGIKIISGERKFLGEIGQ